MLTLRVRACTKCEEYIAIHPNNPVSQIFVNIFEEFHKCHPLITINLKEVKEKYDKYILFVKETDMGKGKQKYKFKKITESQLNNLKSIEL